jgi:hypothetical protein
MAEKTILAWEAFKESHNGDIGNIEARFEGQSTASLR